MRLLPAIVSWLLHGANSMLVHLFVSSINTEAEKAQDPVRGSPRGCKEPLQHESKNSDKNMQQHTVHFYSCPLLNCMQCYLVRQPRMSQSKWRCENGDVIVQESSLGQMRGVQL